MMNAPARPMALAPALVLLVALAGACDSAQYSDGAATARPSAAATVSAVPPPAPACRPPYPSAPLTAENVACADPSGMTVARVLDIIDGDTFDAQIDGREERVRIFGIDTAERGEPCYAEASARLEQLAARDVRMVADARDRDRNGRLLRYVYTPDGRSIDAVLIAEGLAYAWTRDGRLRDALVTLEAHARLDGAGCLWTR
jgi:micrococcal nuclease